MKILSIFVAFSEKMNFKNSSEIKNSSETMDFGFRMKYGKTQKKRTSPCRRLKGIMKYIMTQNQLNEKSLSNETARNMF